MAFSAAVKDQVDRLSSSGHAAGDEPLEAKKILARLDSPIASLAAHKDGPEMANRLAEKEDSPWRVGREDETSVHLCRPTKSMPRSCSWNCIRQHSPTSSWREQRGSRKRLHPGNEGRSAGSSCSPPSPVNLGASLMASSPPHTALSSGAWTATADSLATCHSLMDVGEGGEAQTLEAVSPSVSIPSEVSSVPSQLLVSLSARVWWPGSTRRNSEKL